MGKKIKKSKLNVGPSDEQAIRGKLSKKFDHEFANEPLTTNEKVNNKKTKKRQ
ncbi:small acid-soluble spore protein O [Aquibacillus rhizosphaerae]|uniref:Small acid-soluble spore protein O n=1 Tax=Aquibacillus rhizosphaerae TaxID=3051431 RepID=A0ABT7L8J3_9BACI|nr:small acid-soluble spore protein O [Aquibacillus sp. LR5S19]MDL4840891.1 small acid-soluble spore protein O [Aquibacillus sp. LR5S19]